jgi:hypothetical protein
VTLVANRPVALLDYLRVPYSVSDGDRDRRLTCIDAGPARVCWPSPNTPGWQEATPDAWKLGDVALFGRLLDDRLAAGLLGPRWEHAEAVTGRGGEPAGWTRRRDDRSTFLPFDPGEVVLNFWSEAYQTIGSSSAGGRLKALGRRLYYRVRPVLPRPVQLALRRAIAPLQGRAAFPRWPIEPSLHDLLDLVLEALGRAAGEDVPWIGPWPAPYTWAVVLTHDVETGTGWEHRHLLRDIELEEGFRSAWNLVARRYAVEDNAVAELAAAGFEIGVHGLYHDGRDLESEAMLERRVPEMQAWAKRWGATGFRSPATHRVWEWMPKLGFDYDSSYPDTDPYEPVAGGCCSWFPYRNDSLVELPITLPQDHTLYEILRVPALEQWTAKADAIRSRSGMALQITHPDYLLDEERLDEYRSFLRHVGGLPGGWRALPREVSAWWRRREASSLVASGPDWRVEGPAAGEAVVVRGSLGRSA